jgi:hypothetical protein
VHSDADGFGRGLEVFLNDLNLFWIKIDNVREINKNGNRLDSFSEGKNSFKNNANKYELETISNIRYKGLPAHQMNLKLKDFLNNADLEITIIAFPYVTGSLINFETQKNACENINFSNLLYQFQIYNRKFCIPSLVSLFGRSVSSTR